MTMTIPNLFRRLHDKHKSRKGPKSSEASKPFPSTTSQSPQQPPLLHQLLRSLHIDPQPTSLFLSLPGEIRNRIYAYTLDSVQPTISIRAQPESVLALPIFHICRQIRFEALSLLCESRAFYINGLFTANQFFALVHDHVPNLRRVVVRLAGGWHATSERMDAERDRFLGYIELAEGVCELVVVIGTCPLSEEERAHLVDPSSVGARFLLNVRSVVDREIGMVHKERVTREKFEMLCDQVGLMEAGQVLKRELVEEHEAREEKVFKLRRPLSPDGLVEKVELPAWMPDYLR